MSSSAPNSQPLLDDSQLTNLSPKQRELYERVAICVDQGFRVKSIREKIRQERGKDLHENQVYRAVYQAALAGLLHYIPKTVEHLERDLQRLCGGGTIHVVVVDDSVGFLGKQAFSVKAAQVLHELITTLADRHRDSPLRVANAGGPTVAETVRELSSGKLDLPKLPNFTSLALSQVGYPKQFKLTSAYLAVKLAEIYDGTAYTPLMGLSAEPEYEENIRQAHLFVGGVGSADKGFWPEKMGKSLPASFFGDLFYVPLRQNKKKPEVLEPEPGLAKRARQLKLRPTFSEIEAALKREAPILLLASDDDRHRKAPFVRLIIKNRLASHLVLGAGLAREVLQLDKPQQEPTRGGSQTALAQVGTQTAGGCQTLADVQAAHAAEVASLQRDLAAALTKAQDLESKLVRAQALLEASGM